MLILIYFAYVSTINIISPDIARYPGNIILDGSDKLNIFPVFYLSLK